MCLFNLYSNGISYMTQFTPLRTILPSSVIFVLLNRNNSLRCFPSMYASQNISLFESMTGIICIRIKYFDHQIIDAIIVMFQCYLLHWPIYFSTPIIDINWSNFITDITLIQYKYKKYKFTVTFIDCYNFTIFNKVCTFYCLYSFLCLFQTCIK